MWPDAQDWIIRGRIRRRGHDPQDRNIRGKETGRPVLGRLGLNKQEEPPPPGLDYPGKRDGKT